MRGRTLLLLLWCVVLGLLTRPPKQADRTAVPESTPGPPPVWPWKAPALTLLAAALAAGCYVGYRAWDDTSQMDAVARALTGGDPDRAVAIAARYGCGGCHAIPGVPGADGVAAAPLTGLRQRVYVGGVARNTPDNLVRWIVRPQDLSPRSAMPATGITPAEARDVAAYLYAQ